MDIKKEMLNSYEMQIKAEVDKEEIQKKFNEKYDYFQKNIELKGFRKGKAPLALIKMKLDENFSREFANELADEYISNHVKENKIEKLSRFELKDFELEEGKPFVFTAVFQVKPELEIADGLYKGIKLVKRDDTPTREEIDHILDGYRAQKAVLKPFDGPVDEDTIAYGKLVLTSIDNPDRTETKEDFSIAKGTYIIGEELFESLIGKNRDDTVEKEFAMNSAYYSFEAKEKVKAEFTLKSLKKQELPSLDNNFAKQVDETVKDMDELKEKISRDAEARKKEQNRQRALNEIDEQLVSGLDFTPPPALVDFEFYKLINHYQAQMQRYNIGFNSQEEKDQFLEKRKKDAEKLARLNLILEHITKKESIDVGFQEVKDKINEMVKDEENASELRKEYLKEDHFQYIKEGLVREKLYDFIIENAEMVDEKDEKKTEDVKE